MKKLLSILGSVIIVGSSASAVIACDSGGSVNNDSWKEAALTNQLNSIQRSSMIVDSSKTDVTTIDKDDVLKQINTDLGIDALKIYKVDLIGDIIKMQKASDGYLSDGSATFSITNTSTNEKIKVNSKDKFAINFTTQLAVDQNNSIQGTHAINLAMNAKNKTINFNSDQATLAPFSNMISSLLDMVGGLVDGLPIPDFYKPVIKLLIKDLKTNIFENVKFSSVVKIFDSLFSAANTEFSPIIDLIPAKVFAPEADGTIKNAGWLKFTSALENEIKKVIPGFSLDTVIPTSWLHVPTLSDYIGDLKLDDNFNLRWVIDALAPDIIHMKNFIENERKNGDASVSLMIMKWAMAKHEDVNGDDMSKINNIYKHVKPEEGDPYDVKVSTNFENLVLDLMGYKNIISGEEKDPAGWTYDNKSFYKYNLGILNKSGTKVSKFSYDSGGLALVDVLFPSIGGKEQTWTFSSILSDAFGQLLVSKNLSKLFSLQIPFSDTIYFSGVSIWESLIKIYLQENGVQINDYNISLKLDDNKEASTSSSVFQAYDSSTKTWSDVTNKHKDDADNVFRLDDVVKSSVTNWQVASKLDILVQSKTPGLNYNEEFHDVNIVLPLF